MHKYSRTLGEGICHALRIESVPRVIALFDVHDNTASGEIIAVDQSAQSAFVRRCSPNACHIWGRACVAGGLPLVGALPLGRLTPQHATRNTKHETRNKQHTTRNTQHATQALRYEDALH